MELFDTFSILIVIAALFGYLNHRYLKLPSTIGLMLIALLFSLVVISVGKIFPGFLERMNGWVTTLNFSRLLMEVMLGFMLFAGSIHIKLKVLKSVWAPVLLFSTFSVVISTFLIGGAAYLLLPLVGISIQFIDCLLFGALISPTDPIAVIGILKEAGIAKELEMKIAGESLFNDGVAVVIFLTILEIAVQPVAPSWQEVAVLFAREAGGGIAFGLLIGYAGFYLMRKIDNYKVEVMLSLAVVMGGYSFANALHISGPLAMVAAGILIGNQGKEFAMSSLTASYMDNFWELLDEILNAVLFVLIGMEVVLLEIKSTYLIAGFSAILVVLIARWISIWCPAQLIRFSGTAMDRRTMGILTWGGLRGGISIALALSLPASSEQELWVTVTYCVVAFSILVQGLTIGRLARRGV